MSFFRKLYRLLLTVWDFAYSIAEVLIRRPHTRAGRAAWLRKLCLRVNRSLGIMWETIGDVPASGAIISNHLNFIDIFLHSAMRPCVFVSKIELRSFPLLGWVSMMAGTVYVSRGAGGSAAKAAEGMGKGFRDGLPVIFFPEGTTNTDQNTILPLRSGLLAQAILLEQPIIPAVIRYSLAPRDLAAGKTLEHDFLWGTQTLPQMIWQILGLHELHATITFGKPIPFSEDAVANRKVAAVEARNALLALAGQTPTTF